MIRDTLPDTEMTFTSEGGRPAVIVPWGSAAALHQRLRGLGVRSTLVLDSSRRRAEIRPWEDIGQNRLRSLLAGEDTERPRTS